jgi:hypothetical protein
MCRMDGFGCLVVAEEKQSAAAATTVADNH